MQLPSSVALSEAISGYPIYEIEHPTCTARVALHGAHVMEWQPTSAPNPILYLSPKAVFTEGRAIRGGVPICWPWFGESPTGEGPFHGVARTRLWDMVNVSEEEDGVTIIMETHEGDLKATATIHLGDKLTITLDSVNAGDVPQKVSGALHSYLIIDEITRITVGGLAGTEYLDTVGEPETRTQEGPVVITGETDRIYDSSRPVRLDDPGMDRIIMVQKSGSPSTVVWNPWVDKSRTITDLPIEGYLGFVCIEAAVANDKAVLLEPGEKHQLQTTISIEG